MGGLESWSDYTRFLVALIAVLDPFMAIPVFLGMRTGRSEAQHRRLAGVASLIVLTVLWGAALGGDALLEVLGTSIASFRIAGGLVLLLMALAMLQAQVHSQAAPVGPSAAEPASDISTVVPLAIPLLAGPGALSMVMIEAQHGSWPHRVAILASIAVVCLLLWLMLRFAAHIGNAMGGTGLNIANRLLGLLLAAIAVESMAIGLKQQFPALGH